MTLDLPPKPGRLAMEFELEVGDVVVSDTHGIYFVLHVEPGKGDVVRTLTISSSMQGIFRYPIPLHRSRNYPFLLNGYFVDWRPM